MERSDSVTAGEEMTSPPSPKRPRTDQAEADDGKSRFQFPKLLTFCRQGFTQQSTSQACVQTFPLHATDSQGKLTLQADGTGSTMQGKFSITDITEADMFILNMLYDSDGTVTVSHATADTSSHDGSRQGKSVQCEPPVGPSAVAGDVEDGGRQVQNSGSPIQPVTLTLAEEDVRCQADCSYEEAALDEGPDMQNGALVASEESNQTEIQCSEFREKSPCNKKIEDVKTGLSFSHFADGKSFSTKPQVCPTGSLAEVGENNGETLELQNVASCDGKTEARFNEGRKGSFSEAAAVGAAAKDMSTLNADECEAEKQQNVEESTVKVRIETADTVETRESVGISQTVGEGDNDAASFTVIDRAILMEADLPAEENRNASFELSEKVCENEGDTTVDTKALQDETVKLPGPEQPGRSPFQSQEQAQYEKDTQAVASITHDQTGDKSDTENQGPTSPHSTRSATPHSAEDQSGGSPGTVGYELKEQDQSGSLSGSPAHPEAPTQGDTARMEKKNDTQEAEDGSLNSTDGVWLEQEIQQQNIHQNTMEMPLCKSENGFADHAASRFTVCDEVNTCTKAAVEGRDVEEKLNEQEKSSVASEQREANLADVQLPACNILKAEISGVLDSEENEEKLEECEQAQDENMEDLTETTNNDAFNVKSFAVVESQGESEMEVDDTMHEKSSQQSANMLYMLSPETCQTFLKTLEAASEEKASDETLNPKTCEAEINNHFPASSNTENFRVESQSTDHRSFSTPHSCNVRFSPTPSALAFSIRAAPAGFDTFEKIQLSPDDNDEDASGLGNDTPLTSPPRQLLEKQPHCSQSHPSIQELEEARPEAESNVESSPAYGFLNSNGASNVSSPVPTADVIAQGWPDQKPRCESTFQIYDCTLDSSAASIESDASECEGEFQMKKQFDTVLKELKLFFDISASDMASCGDSEGASSPELLREIIEALEGDASKCKGWEESTEEPDARDTSLDDTDEDHSLACEAGCSSAKSREAEQEVPVGNSEHLEAPRRSEVKDTEPAEREQRQTTWSPSFMSLPLVEQLTQKLLEPVRRLEPLRTCSRPIRVGLSKKAKTGHLHQPHPYN